MAPSKAWTVRINQHPGSSQLEIDNEPNWGVGHQHRVGYVNGSDRVPGMTSDGDYDLDDYSLEIERAKQKRSELNKEVSAGQLVNFRDLIDHQTDFHLIHQENRPSGWRFVLDATEDWVKNEEDWPSNLKKREQKEEERKKNEEEEEDKKQTGNDDSNVVESQQEHEWRRNSDSDKHNGAYATGDGHINGKSDSHKGQGKHSEEGAKKEQGDSRSQDGSEDQPLEDKYSPQELALLRVIDSEKNYISHLEESDGKDRCPPEKATKQISIDEKDQFSPDNWIARSPRLFRLTGKHPLNAEPRLDDLYAAGLITPNDLHYVRNHGAVPHLLWEFHTLNVEYDGSVSAFSMEQLAGLEAINIQVALACDGNRRKELNMIRKSKGFNWGPGAVSCAYWKGPLLRDVLLEAGVPSTLPKGSKTKTKRYWVNFEGSDDLSEGKYATSIPFDYAMGPENDVLLAYEMNNAPLPPDHGYPLRLIIPGYVGGRCVKWLRRIWISDHENESHYHLWDNRVLPSFVTEMDGPFAETLFTHPDTACNEQNLNSIIVRPAHKEALPLSSIRKGKSYRIAGIAYDGGGHQVQRVEVSLDDGQTWLYCVRKFPPKPIRHGNKFWAWLHWHVDVDAFHLLEASSITVRCFNVFKNTQPQLPSWNIMGMMNNCWYVVKLEKSYAEGLDVPQIVFRHPTEPGQGQGGWMQDSTANKIAAAKQAAGAPDKHFTREEIEKHNARDDCWIVVDGKVYDATSVLEWHPGGPAAIMAHAGKVHQDTTDEFASIHDDFANQKLNECALGNVTEKTANFIRKNAADGAADEQRSSKCQEQEALQKHRWVPVKLLKKHDASADSRTYTFQLPGGKPNLGLGTCQHILLGFHLKDKMLIRSYTPTRPLLPAPQGDVDNGSGSDATQPWQDGNGTFDVVVKTYFPDENQPGGAMSNILDCIPIGEEVEMRGPTGDIVYNSMGNFTVEGKERHFKRVSLVLGGSGLTPGYALLARILLSPEDKTEVRVIDANKSEADILMREELTRFQEQSGGQLQIAHILSHPGDNWDGLQGHVDEKSIRDTLFPPGEDSVAFMCGPPAMIQKAALPALKDWGYVEDENLFGF